MTQFEIDLRTMLTTKENALLDIVLEGSDVRHGVIASLVARMLRRMEREGEMELYYPEAK